MKKIHGIYSAPEGHWVGDGFPVRSLFSYNDHGQKLSPFILLDYAGPALFEPAEKIRGVGEHPHRGFETVTIVYQGEVDHRDSAGGGGHIGPGDVQWMTAAAGVVHDEFHSEHFTRSGGTLEMVQLWVNLPAREKLSPPRYQTLLDAEIPRIPIDDNAGELRVIAGEYDSAIGPALTFTRMNVWDVNLVAEKKANFHFQAGDTLAVVVLSGEVLVNETEIASAAQLVIMDRENVGMTLLARTNAQLLILSGDPIDEPVVGYGPFVMNTKEQITQAIEDYNGGLFGKIDIHG